MKEIWDAFDYMDVINNVPDNPLPNVNRGSWYCPVATQEDADELIIALKESEIDKVYDLGAGDMRFSVYLDKKGFDVIAYETIQQIATYGLNNLPSNDVDLRTRDYWGDWFHITHDKAVFVALGRLNKVPSPPKRGIAYDGMSITEETRVA